MSWISYPFLLIWSQLNQFQLKRYSYHFTTITVLVSKRDFKMVMFLLYFQCVLPLPVVPLLQKMFHDLLDKVKVGHVNLLHIVNMYTYQMSERVSKWLYPVKLYPSTFLFSLLVMKGLWGLVRSRTGTEEFERATEWRFSCWSFNEKVLHTWPGIDSLFEFNGKMKIQTYHLHG